MNNAPSSSGQSEYDKNHHGSSVYGSVHQSWWKLWGQEEPFSNRKGHVRGISGSCGSSTMSYGSLNHDEEDYPKMNAFAYSNFGASSARNGSGAAAYKYRDSNQFRSTNNINKKGRRSLVRGLIFIMTGHFGLMVMYTVFLYYQRIRLQNDDYANDAQDVFNSAGSSWISPAGWIANPALGPNAPTLHLFGIYNPILVLQNYQIWRIVTASIVNTSFVQYVLHVGLIYWGMGSMEEGSWGQWPLLFLYVLSCGSGGILCIVSNMEEKVVGEDSVEDSIAITGLVGAGLMGCFCARIVELTLRRWSYKSRQNYYLHHERGGVDRSPVVLAVSLLWMSGYYLPFCSLSALMGGCLMGISCGLYWWAHFVRERYSDWDEEEYTGSQFLNPKDDASTVSQSSLQDLEDAFNAEFHYTPPRMFDPSGPPPSSDSKGMDTPLMRRSIITSPEDDEEDILSQLNGGTGLKRRKYTSTYASGSKCLSPSSKSTNRKTTGGKAGTLRFIGLSMGVMSILIPLVLMSFVLEVPSEVALSDSVYGCRTMSSLYKFSVGDDDQSNQENYIQDVENGESICGEVCLPLSVVNRVRSNTNDIDWIAKPCSFRGYNCLIAEDEFDLNESFEITRELFTACNN